MAYASLNYRGSVTFGRRFREGFIPAIGDRELEDIETAVRWLVAEGVAEPGKVFVTGASYGGFLTLLSMGRPPGLFAGGPAHAPMADWLAGYEDMNPALRAAWSSFSGAKWEDGLDRFVRASPITYVANVVASVWINQATHDTRTPPKQVRHYEVVPAARRVPDAVTARHGIALTYDAFDWSCERFLAEGSMMPPDSLDRIRGHDAILLGTVGYPGVPDHVSLWSLESEEAIGRPRVAHRPGPVTAVAFSDDARLLAAADADGKVLIWHLVEEQRNV